MAAEEWRAHARNLADQVTHPGSRWYEQIANTPRHLLVPAWWERDDDGARVLRHGDLAGAYADRSLVTRVGPLHADHASSSDRPEGCPTSSSTLPSLVVTMYRYANLTRGLAICDVGTGSGYGAALLARRYGDQHVTSLDVDPYLVSAATRRLARLDLYPTVVTADATAPLPGQYDRIVSMMSVPSIPPSWLAALRPGGRLVTTIRGTSMILTATRTADGVFGRIERDRAGFMSVRTGPDYPPEHPAGFDRIADLDGEEVTVGRYPVLNVADAWDLSTALTLAVPGVRHDYRAEPDGGHTALLAHPDGSWARATAVGTDPPTVHQGGPRRLWDALDAARDDWLRLGWTPWLGARAMVRDDGSIKLLRGTWRATIPAAPGW
ncbi:Protein-L-isoaspartate O-methyltransferase [Parafrankia irregularis]|uniref:Protein-L-isoaspartate O-methyltransferase n=1 Tax=Parafrankia irregularis TaxID=795642 RepID=A0A0S4QVA1_9ACTN|nr:MULTISPECIES: methyltransferase domain-containing protein [Parafrankia]MBE3202431.1 methyltransferase domain-containing protein [Parafrankia sp. CH37]CUU58946.1 Protein-L-isoaspartate O-methyltransferase [Parafrankia irregularis]